jgi:hypothetical protein
LVVFPVQWDVFHLIKNWNWVTKIIDRNNKSGKVGNETLGEADLLINGRMNGLHVIHCIDAGNAALKYLVGHRSIKVNEIITPCARDPEIFAGDRLAPAQENLHTVCLWWLALLKSEKKKDKGYVVQTNCHTSTGQSHGFHFCIAPTIILIVFLLLSFIYPVYSMEYDDHQRQINL